MYNYTDTVSVCVCVCQVLRRSLEASVKRSSRDSAGEESEDEWVEEQIERDDSNDSISDITLPPSPKPSQPIRSQPSSSDLIVLDFGPSPIGMLSLLKTDYSKSCVYIPVHLCSNTTML